MNTLKKHTRTKKINGRKYIFTGKSTTLANAQKMAQQDKKLGYNVKIFKLLNDTTDFVWRVYTEPKKKGRSK